MTSKQRHLAAGLIAIGVLGSASVSQAQVIYTGYGQTDFNYTGAPTVTVNAPGVANGGHEGTLSNDFLTLLSSNSLGTSPTSIETYCIDIYHTNNQGALPFQSVELIQGQTYSATRDNPTDTSTYGQQGLGRAAWLVNNYQNDPNVDKVALQLAIWKAEYETQGDSANFLNLTSNLATVYFTNFGGLTSLQLTNVLADATAYLTASVAAGGGQYAVAKGIWVSYQGDAQDQIFAPSFLPNSLPLVPEPATMMMCATAFVVVSGVAWRRRRKVEAAQA
jgi:hypothetical protein